jgi:hypothetical protein
MGPDLSCLLCIVVYFKTHQIESQISKFKQFCRIKLQKKVLKIIIFIFYFISVNKLLLYIFTSIESYFISHLYGHAIFSIRLVEWLRIKILRAIMTSWYNILAAVNARRVCFVIFWNFMVKKF